MRFSKADLEQMGYDTSFLGFKQNSKYRNKKTFFNGIYFDSKKEADYFAQLLFLKNAGKIERIELQKDFTLQEAYTTEKGERIKAIRYRADFVVYYIDHVEVVDVKGYKTKEYNLKKKLLLAKYPDINFKEV